MEDGESVRHLLFDSSDQALRCRHDPVKELAVTVGRLDDQVKVHSERWVADARITERHDEFELVGALI